MRFHHQPEIHAVELVARQNENVLAIAVFEISQTLTRRVGGARPSLPEEFNALRQRMSDLFQTKVQMTCSPSGKGKISIGFTNEEELERIMAVFDGIS